MSDPSLHDMLKMKAVNEVSSSTFKLSFYSELAYLVSSVPVAFCHYIQYMFLLQLFDQLLVLTVCRFLYFQHFLSAGLHLGFEVRRQQLPLDPLLPLPPQQSQDLFPLVGHGCVPLPLLLSLPDTGNTRRLWDTGFGWLSSGVAALLRSGHRKPLPDVCRHQPGLERRHEGQGAPELPGVGHVLRRGAVKHGEELLKVLLLLRRDRTRGHFAFRTESKKTEGN